MDAPEVEVAEDSAFDATAALEFEREGNVYWVDFAEAPAIGSEQVVEVFAAQQGHRYPLCFTGVQGYRS